MKTAATEMDERAATAAVAGGVMGAVLSVIASRYGISARQATPRLILGCASSATCYSISRDLATEKQQYHPLVIGGVSGLLSGLLLSLFLGPGHNARRLTAGVGAALGVGGEFVRHRVNDWRTTQILARHGIDLTPEGMAIEQKAAERKLAEQPVKSKSDISKDLKFPSWLPVRSEESSKLMTQRHAEIVLLKRELQDLQVEIEELQNQSQEQPQQ
eukprot:m.36912 g.36912  ORF g.36912 m.36912 type:complete len:216 (+) comp11321_c0_seq1:42-689(+)